MVRSDRGPSPGCGGVVAVIQQRGLLPTDRPLLEELLSSLPAFTPEERAVALELVDDRLSRPDSDDYRFILSLSSEPANGGGAPAERLAGYLCYGRTPMTRSTYDLYWLGTSPDFARSGVARDLVASMEGEIAREGGGIIRVETGSREGHGAAVHFYDAVGFSRTATIPDFYAPGDDLIIFTRRVNIVSAPSLPAFDEAALYDAAFGYRDYAAERDFLLACARRFGAREVRRVLAWACGPARHVSAFADVGVAAVGADASEAMIAYAQRLTRSSGPSPPGALGPAARRPEVRFVKAALDERPDVGAPVDLSFVPLSSIHQLSDEAALEAHLRLAATVLKPGGLHVIEATHPTDLTPSGVHHTEWTERRGDQVIDARFRMHIDKLAGQRVPVTLEVMCSPTRKGSASSRSAPRLRQEDRWYIPDIEGWRAAIARVPELTLVAELGDFNVDVRFEHAAAWRLILVLRRA
jgi:ribosomal protein S18 acetylase RimI-like enzyme